MKRFFLAIADYTIRAFGADAWLIPVVIVVLIWLGIRTLVTL